MIACLVSILVVSSCHRRASRSVHRLAVISFTNLTGDPSLDWEGAALAGIIAVEASASTHTYPFQAANLRDARLNQADRFLEGYYEKRGGGLDFHLSVEDADSHKFSDRIEVQSANDGGLFAAADTVARNIDRRTRKFSTSNPQAIRAWGESLIAADAAKRAALLRQAIADDPNFGRAYVDLVQLFEVTGNRAGALTTLQQGLGRGAMLTDLDRARLDGMAGGMTGNYDQRRTALVELSRLITTDPSVLQSLAEMEYSSRQFVAAVDHYKSALALDPSNVVLMNQLGYAEAFRGNLDGATAALKQYRDAQPNQPNPLDSLGEVHFFLGHFDDAERYFLQAQSKGGAGAATELVKAAEARLMQGNLSGADALFNQWASARNAAHDPTVAVNKAQWLYLTGRRKEAMAATQSVGNAEQGDLSAYASAQMVFWSLAAGDRAGAQTYASRVSATAVNPSLRNLAALCRFISVSRGSAGDWNMAVSTAFPDQATASMRGPALAYALLYSKDFNDAAAVLRSVYEQTPPTDDGQIRTLYAWSLVNSGRPLEAAPLVVTYPLPLGNGEPLFASLMFPRFIGVRAVVLDRQGHSKDAQTELNLYQKYAGDMPSIFPPPKF